MTFAGLIPMHTPEEAIAELRHCRELGIKVAALPEGVLRPIPEPAAEGASPFLWPGQTPLVRHLRSRKRLRLRPGVGRGPGARLPVTFHGGMGLRPGLWTFTNNYCANHIGVFGQNMFPLCKSLYLGGVTQRFSGMPFAFLECGVSWASQLLIDVVEHWHKRRPPRPPAPRPGQPGRRRPGHLSGHLRRSRPRADGPPRPGRAGPRPEAGRPAGAEVYDDFAHLEAADEDELVRLFADSMYFGCEADDRGVVTAFSPMNPRGATVRAMFSSDIGHWDVPDISAVVPESFELVEDGLLTPEQYRMFVFDNAARLYTGADPDFFVGTAIEAHVRQPAAALRS